MKILKLIPYIIIIFLLFRIVYLNKQNTILIDKTATLEESLSKQTIIYKDKIVYKERVGDSVIGTSIKQETVYIPVDGKVEILNPLDTSNINLSLIDKVFNKVVTQEDGTVILIKNKGFTISPEIAGLYSNKLELGIQLKLAYWSRYNVGLGITNETTLYGYLSRNISDLIPFIHNTSAQISYGKDLENGGMKFLFGLNVRL